MTVEKNIPIPPRSSGRSKKYHFEELEEIGDSVFYPSNLPLHEAKVVSSSTQSWCRARDCKGRFAVRTVEGGVRVWRVK